MFHRFKNSIFKSISIIGLLKVSSMPVTLVISVSVARSLGPSDFGVYTLALAILSVIAIPIGSGFSQLITRELIRYEKNNHAAFSRGLISFAQLWVLAIWVFTILLMAFSASVTNQPITQTAKFVSIFILVLIPVIGVNEIRKGILAGSNRIIQSQIPELLIKPLVQVSLVGSLFYFGYLSLFNALTAFLTASVAAMLVGTIFLRQLKHQNKDKAKLFEIRRWLFSLFPFIGLSFLSTANSQLVIIILGMLGTTEDAANLRIAQSGALLVSLPLSIVNLSIGPYIATEFHKRNFSGITRTCKRCSRTSLFLALCFCVPFLIFPSFFISVSFGEEYVVGAALPLAILCVTQIINVGFGSVGEILSMSGHEKVTLKGLALGISITLLFSLPFSYQFGATGVAFAILIGTVAWNVILLRSVVSKLGINPTVF